MSNPFRRTIGERFSWWLCLLIGHSPKRSVKVWADDAHYCCRCFNTMEDR